MVPDGNPATSPVTTIAGYFQCTWLCAHPTASSFTYAEVQFTVPDSATGIYYCTGGLLRKDACLFLSF